MTSARSNDALLRCGMIAGPLFMITSVVQGLTRSGFDLTHQPISFLSLGSIGWLQMLDFVVAGALIVAFAVGIWRTLRGQRGAWAAIPAAGLGLGLIVAGLFPPDPGFGYPLGTPDGPPRHVTYHSTMHGVGFMLSFVCFAVMCAIIARDAARHRQWAFVAYTVVSAAAALALGMSPGDSTVAVRDLGAALLLFTWIGVEAVRLSKSADGLA